MVNIRVAQQLGLKVALFLFLGLVFWQSDVQAFHKASKLLTAHDAVLLAISKSPQAKNIQLQDVLDNNSLKVSLAAYQPQWTLGSSYNRTTGSPKTYSVDLGLMNTFKMGTTIEAHYSPYTDSGKKASISVTQPLLRGFGVGQLNVSNAEDTYEQAKLSRQKTIVGIITSTLSAYWSVLQAQKNLEVEQLGYKQAKKRYKQYQIKVKVGQLARSSLIEQHNQVLHYKLRLLQQKNAVDTSMKNLLLLLGLKLDTRVKLDTTLSIHRGEKLPSLEQSIRVGQQYNPDVIGAGIDLRVAKRSLESANNMALPELDLTARVDQDGNKTTGVSVSVPIDDTDIKSSVLQARVALQQTELNRQQILRENRKTITSTWNTLMSQRRQIVLQEEKLKSSNKVYDLTMKRNLHGMASSLDVIIQQQTLTSDQQALINLKIDYLKDHVAFLALQGKLLERWHLSLDKEHYE